MKREDEKCITPKFVLQDCVIHFGPLVLQRETRRTFRSHCLVRAGSGIPEVHPFSCLVIRR